MKTFPYIVLISATLGILSRGAAQDAPTRPLREPVVETSPQVSPAESESPTPTPQEHRSTPKKTPGATPESSPRENEEKPAAKTGNTKAKIQSLPAASPQKSATKIENKPSPNVDRKPAAETSARSSEDRRSAAVKLEAMEKEWEATFNDPAVIEKALADDFAGTSPVGEIVSKKSLIRDAKNAKSSSLSSVAHDLDVHFYGPSLAVVVGAAKETGKNKMQHNYRFTDTWVKRHGKWQCVASQATLLPRK